jgi:hypothetical protein
LAAFTLANFLACLTYSSSKIFNAFFFSASSFFWRFFSSYSSFLWSTPSPVFLLAASSKSNSSYGIFPSAAAA